MRKVVVAVVAFIVLAAAVVTASSMRGRTRPLVDRPWEKTPVTPAHVDHAKLIEGPFADGPAVTRACLECHPNAAKQMMRTEHFTWAGDEIKDPKTGEMMKIGKRNLLNNFCIHAMPNIGECSTCHAGYGWEDEHYTFDEPTNVDCLVCHDQSNTYVKTHGGHPLEGVDLVAAAKSVGMPSRNNCGVCHFAGAGGDGVKHGDLDGSLYHPTERLDVHMGRLDFECATCHRTREHQISGSSMSVSIGNRPRVGCTDCHLQRPHQNDRLDAHTKTVACETCHIPRMAIDTPTQMYWDWSVAGEDRDVNDRYIYMKIKGSFKYAQNIRPKYFWYNGHSERYLTGDRIDPDGPVRINYPLGGPKDPTAKIWPFKVHYENQIYDTENLILMTPKTWGPGGYWTEFDWDKACRLGAEVTGIPYSGHYGFVETEMYWPLAHMVQRKEKALQCGECHGNGGGIMDWAALGFDGDPAFRGNRRRMELIRNERGGSR